MNKMQERDKFNTSCRKHSVEITIDHVTRHIAWERDDCPVCRIISLEQQLAAAHRAGWEQAKREAYSLSQQHSLLSSTKSGEIEINELAIAIAALEYKEPTNEH